MAEKEKIKQIIEEDEDDSYDDEDSDEFEDSINDISEEEDSYDNETEEDDSMLFFKENPLKAIFLQNKEILEILNSITDEDEN